MSINEYWNSVTADKLLNEAKTADFRFMQSAVLAGMCEIEVKIRK